MPNLKEYENLIREPLEDDGSPKQAEAEAVLTALVGALQMLESDTIELTNGYASGDTVEQRRRLEDKVGPLIAGRVMQMGRPKFAKAIIEA